MRKIIVAGIVIILAMFLVTCDALFPDVEEDEIIGYTDVEYSDGGAQVKVWIDGSKPIPVTKRSQRAMSTDLSRMAYDYLEVIFFSGTTIARSQWELGQSAGISGIVRAPADVTVLTPNYAHTAGKANDYALMAVGTKDGKTLLGIGEIGNVDGNAVFPAKAGAIIIRPNAEYVTFYLESVKTGLITEDEVVSTTGLPDVATNPVGARYDSFTGLTPSSRSALGDSQYPMYVLPSGSTTGVKYTFYGAPSTYKQDLITTSSTATDPPRVSVERRIPRYLYSGRYMVAKGAINTKARVTVPTTYAAATLNEVPLEFTSPAGVTGIFSFYIDITVYLKNRNEGTNGGALKPVPWHIRTGFGSELYSLDDGAASGGCVLIGVGAVSLDWLDIQWEWLQD